ncbi:hypothetical protein Bhyg_01049 [Pseudolycoriella hygida]|uniref:Uncharacterized protein n=1 Tax=Pseudolycoriella hygida TaxID=35572 RepID=A0A9Q0N8U9_9DIPT|nr:hypothetical protein Bhyg_01049 [Pseudolycoriella hygida]
MYPDESGQNLKVEFEGVMLGNEGSATCTKQSAIPDDVERLPLTFTGIEGDWKLNRLGRMPQAFQYPTNCVTCGISKQENDDENGTWRRTYVVSTDNDVARPFMIMEKWITDIMLSASIIEVDANGNLLVQKDQFTSIWTRYDKRPQPFIGDPFVSKPLR